MPFFPIVWPAEHAPLLFGVIGFLLAGMAFTVDTKMLVLGPHPVAQRLVGPGNRTLLVDRQLVILSSGLLWASVVAP